MRIFLLLSSVILVLTSCKEDRFTLTFTAENVDGLELNSSIEINGLEVGKVSSIELNKDYEVIVETEFKKEMFLPIDSKFRLASLDFLGTRGIIIEKGIESEYLKDKDIIKLLPQEELIDRMDSLIFNLQKNLIKNNPVLNKLDSLESELEKINEKLNK
jgi:phospholipid/cholesterol/gamma-HCH transport system substrate-binding protein